MAHVITQPCCNDASCVAVCPVNCIHPTPEERGFDKAEMLYIDAETFIDCGACLDVCPVGAIVTDDELSDDQLRYVDINAMHYEFNDYPPRAVPAKRETPVTIDTRRPLRVAIVGSGPSACYAAEGLLTRRDLAVEVHMFERLSTPWGLVRFGVAPDHLGTKNVTEQFERTLSRKGVRLYLNVEVGRHISHAELLEHHDAVIYAVGASADRRLGISGEDLPGSVGAADLVGWYNGHPDLADLDLDLDCERAVVVGNGNVALDIARILATDVDRLRHSDIAEHALEALAGSSISEVLVVGRRGPTQAAYTTPELLALGYLPGINVRADPSEVEIDEVSRAVLTASPDPVAALKGQIAGEYATAPRGDATRTIGLKFRSVPLRFTGTDRVTGVDLARTELVLGKDGSVVTAITDHVEHLECGLIVRAIGHRGNALPGVPFDHVRGTVPNDGGRVIDPDTGERVPGVYVTGWIKRGPSGVIGTNRTCAEETVRGLLLDAAEGRSDRPRSSRDELEALLSARQPHTLGYADWQAIDAHELGLGADRGRPRVKLVDRQRMLDVSGVPTSAAS